MLHSVTKQRTILDLPSPDDVWAGHCQVIVSSVRTIFGLFSCTPIVAGSTKDKKFDMAGKLQLQALKSRHEK